jgi:uncharacterized membrane protein YbhN (UPF0104 family)
MRPRLNAWAWARLAGGAAILAVVVVRVGTGPFVDAVRLTDARALAVAVAVGAVTTACCAWRWGLVARGLGVAVPLPAAIGAYYRSQFLNVTLPGGVVGDVHRGVVHGRQAGELGRALRAVVWERSAGQTVQVVLTVAALLALASPLRSSIPAIVALLFVGAAAAALAAWAFRRTRLVRLALDDVRRGVLAPGAWPGILLASTVAVAGHLAVFLVAARTAGVDVSAERVLPLALVVLLASAVPTNIAGWGPREGAAAWAFGAAGLGAATGATVSVVYGVMVLFAALPGAVLLLTRPRLVSTPDPGSTRVRRAEGARHG